MLGLLKMQDLFLGLEMHQADVVAYQIVERLFRDKSHHNYQIQLELLWLDNF